jgi:undecaprenyl-diphosphatase
MTWLQALILGIVEGVTEYLPVSSTGHLILAQRLMGIGEGEAADALAICIQGGAIVAVLALYYRRVGQMANGVLGRDPAGRRLALNIVVAFLPAVVIGLLFEKRIKHALFNLPAITAAWLVGGLAILAAAWWQGHRTERAGEGIGLLDELAWPGALAIGLWQCLAMWPGTSRSLVTIVGGLVAGLGVAAAIEFSFLLGVLTLTAATAHDLLKHGHALAAAYSVSSLVLGFLSAALAATLAVKWMVSYLRGHGLALFGWYRVVLAVVVGASLLAGYSPLGR